MVQSKRTEPDCKNTGQHTRKEYVMHNNVSSLTKCSNIQQTVQHAQKIVQCVRLVVSPNLASFSQRQEISATLPQSNG